MQRGASHPAAKKPFTASAVSAEYKAALQVFNNNLLTEVCQLLLVDPVPPAAADPSSSETSGESKSNSAETARKYQTIYQKCNGAYETIAKTEALPGFLKTFAASASSAQKKTQQPHRPTSMSSIQRIASFGNGHGNGKNMMNSTKGPSGHTAHVGRHGHGHAHAHAKGGLGVAKAAVGKLKPNAVGISGGTGTGLLKHPAAAGALKKASSTSSLSSSISNLSSSAASAAIAANNLGAASGEGKFAPPKSAVKFLEALNAGSGGGTNTGSTGKRKSEKDSRPATNSTSTTNVSSKKRRTVEKPETEDEEEEEFEEEAESSSSGSEEEFEVKGGADTKKGNTVTTSKRTRRSNRETKEDNNSNSDNVNSDGKDNNNDSIEGNTATTSRRTRGSNRETKEDNDNTSDNVNNINGSKEEPSSPRRTSGRTRRGQQSPSKKVEKAAEKDSPPPTSRVSSRNKKKRNAPTEPSEDTFLVGDDVLVYYDPDDKWYEAIVSNVNYAERKDTSDSSNGKEQDKDPTTGKSDIRASRRRTRTASNVSGEKLIIESYDCEYDNGEHQGNIIPLNIQSRYLDS